MGRRKREKQKKSTRERMASFKIHGMVYLGVNLFFWGIWAADGGHSHDMWPMYPGMAWGLGLFLHYVGGVLGPKWREDARLADQREKGYQSTQEDPYFSSEYSMDEQPERSKRDREDWDGIDVSIHDVDD
ncbi:MAG: 2TM domain-containing protein [Bacteroidota bacterium]